MAEKMKLYLYVCMQAAGGLAAGCSVKHTLVKECEEEACIPPSLAQTATPVGTIRYITCVFIIERKKISQ